MNCSFIWTATTPASDPSNFGEAAETTRSQGERQYEDRDTEIWS